MKDLILNEKEFEYLVELVEENEGLVENDDFTVVIDIDGDYETQETYLTIEYESDSYCTNLGVSAININRNDSLIDYYPTPEYKLVASKDYKAVKYSREFKKEFLSYIDLYKKNS